MSICIAIGHGKSSSGGYDPGAVSGNYKEFEIAREIGKYAADYYNENYAENCDLINYDGEYFLSERYNLANRKGYEFLAEIHLNSGKGTGCEVFHSVKSSSKTAETISKAIADAFGIRNCGAKTRVTSSGADYFGIIRETTMKAVLIETVFIDTPSDIDLIKNADGQKKMGETIAKAIAKDRGINAKDPAENPPSPDPTIGDELYKVQAGAFKNKSNAEKYVRQLKDKGFDAVIIKGK